MFDLGKVLGAMKAAGAGKGGQGMSNAEKFASAARIFGGDDDELFKLAAQMRAPPPPTAQTILNAEGQDISAAFAPQMGPPRRRGFGFGRY